ncbi:hypothetical protein [Parvibium lacunae]|uniref:hypothetical protein n=1 Tax=Parvibium lacunae TaxID=1888893 RepID=UPI0019616038|nr:hypothetical protein [Parvibium lacunae]
MDSKKLRDYAWMSQASYLGLDDAVPYSQSSLFGQLIGDAFNKANLFFDGQAKLFTNTTNGYSFVSQLPNTPNGTSLTVFKSNADGSYDIAVRGTEPGAQLFTDLVEDFWGVVLAGKAKVQILEAFRYYKQLTTAGGQPVIYTTAEQTAMSNLILSGGIPPFNTVENLSAASAAFKAYTANDKGLGAVGQTLIPAGATLNFTGHSLGGHVAYLLAGLIESTSGGRYNLGDVVTYNAPGENALIYEWQNWFGFSQSTQVGTIGSRHLALYGEGGLNVTAGLGQVIGTRVGVDIEKEGELSIANHAITKLSDALALQNVLNQLDNSLTTETMNNLQKAGANNEADSLENVLDGLRKIILGPNQTPTKTPGTADSNTTRNNFYTNLYQLLNPNQQGTPTGPFASLMGKLQITATTANAESAKSDFGQFLSLYYLTPFTVSTPDAGSQAKLLLTQPQSLIDAWSNDQAKRATNTNSELNFSDKWLADRRSMQSWLIQGNTQDNPSTDSGPNGKQIIIPSNSVNDSWLFIDKSTPTPQSILINPITSTTVTHLVSFGGTGNDLLEGQNHNDRLYGGAGNDTPCGKLQAVIQKLVKEASQPCFNSREGVAV